MRISSGQTDDAMDGRRLCFTARTFLGFLLVILLQTSTEAQEGCFSPSPVTIAENNTVGEVVTTITVESGGTVEFQPPPENPNNPFTLIDNKLITTRVLDYETGSSHVAKMICTTASNLTSRFSIIVLLTNRNDNPPVFPENPYYINVNELSPVGTTVTHISAEDLDDQQPTYTLTPESAGFKLKSPTLPDIIIETPLEYDKVKSVQLILTAQDEPLTPGDVTHTASTTIMITIVDVDNRPPWFEPCVLHEIEGAVICQSSGYTGYVVLNEQQAGPLTLKPGPLYATDGDSGLNEEIVYSFVGGNGNGLFEINPDTGNITMLKPADTFKTIQLTVVAAQKFNSNQYATTTVTFSVGVKSLHPPRFQMPEYQGIITGVGSMAMDLKNKDQPLQILAVDDDYAASGGLNPSITYEIKGSHNFSLINGYLFMTSDVPVGMLSLQVVATDTTNDESATAQLSLEVTAGPTTSEPLNTTHSMATSVGEPTTNPNVSADTTIYSTIYSPTGKSSNFTTNPGGFDSTDMAVLGATLGVLLFICVVVIGVLACQLQRGKADWRKIYETNVFRSSLGKGSGGQKEGVQYTNDAFQNDEDGNSTGSSNKDEGHITATEDMKKAAKENIGRTLEQINALLRDDTSQAGSDKSDSEKQVKPILTKERRVDEGYKSVWFKEDIDPDAKEEVVIIPPNNDSEEEEDEEQISSSTEEDEEDGPQKKTPRVTFSDTDLDSGQMEDPAWDSDNEDGLSSNL